MPRYYCDYCDTYLTHDSPSVRKQHNAGYKHKANVRSYYQQYEAQLNQSLIDQKVKEHLVYRQVAPSFQMRPGLPGPPVQVPMQVPMYNPLMQGMRPPPVLPRPPPGAPGYTMPQMMPPPLNAPPPPGQLNSLPRPVNALPPPPAMAPGSAGMPTSSGAPPMFAPMYQGNMTAAAPPPGSSLAPMYQGNMTAAAAPPPGSSDESPDANSHAAEAN